MATKLKNIFLEPWSKGVLFLVTVSFITFAVLQVQTWLYTQIQPQVLWLDHYMDGGYEQDLNQAFHEMESYLEIRDPQILSGTPYLYFIEIEQGILTNVDGSSPWNVQNFVNGYYVLEEGQWIAKGNPPKNLDPLRPYAQVSGSVSFGFDEDFFKENEERYQLERATLLPLFLRTLISLGSALLLTMILVATVGLRKNEIQIQPGFLDRVFTDVLIVPFLLLGFFWLVIMDGAQVYGTGSYILTPQQRTYLILVGVATFGACLLLGWILSSFVRKWKRGTFFTHSLIGHSTILIRNFFVGLLDERRFRSFPLTKILFYRQRTFILLSFVMVLLTFFLLFTASLLAWIPPLLELGLIYRYIQNNNKTYKAINLGFNESLEEQMKAERMKVALITNVSHDLKTPLTSIISYTDLLSKEENLSENAREYLQILSDKSNRLKKIVADLFDLAKSTTENIHVEWETLDLKTLLQQTVADMSDEISASQRTLRTSFPEESVFVNSDGNKLYRIFQNILDNALKYSMPGTRIFLDLTTAENRAIVTLKNTAGYEMDFTEEEILQRFTRGDASRTTEGSGLGLSIAESFTKVCGGDFNLEIDGDQFKITLRFPLRNPA